MPACVPISANRPDAYRLGSVGKVFANNEVRLASDGEIEVRSGGLFEKYLHDEERTLGHPGERRAAVKRFAGNERVRPDGRPLSHQHAQRLECRVWFGCFVVYQFSHAYVSGVA